MKAFNSSPTKSILLFSFIFYSFFIFSCENLWIEDLVKYWNRTVLFDSNGGSAVDSQTVVKGKTATRPDNPTKVEDGAEYFLVNWYDNEELAEPHYNFNTPVTADITLYAKWSDTFYTVTFDSCGGSEVAAQTVTEGGTASMPDNPTKDGNVFDNWYSNVDGNGEPYNFDDPVIKDLTLYAKWIEIEITLNETEISLTVGDTATLIATVSPDNATNQNVTWSSSNNAVATVSNGTVIAVGGGTATITVASVADPSVKATCTVTVISAEDEEDFGAGAVIHGIFYVPVVAGRDGSISWETALSRISEGYPDGNGKNYIINLLADITIDNPGTAATFTGTGIAVSLRGDHKLTLSGTGSLLRTAAGQTLILRGPSLQGSGANDAALVYVGGGTVAMHDGAISGNTGGTRGGGVYVANNGTFTMHSGTISGNTATNGGGVGVLNGTFAMHGGTISNNTANNNTLGGGGVYVGGGTFTMHGGTISGNKASAYGGGVFVDSTTFQIVNGTIHGNTEADGIKNTAYSGAALYNNASATYGTFPGGGAWKSNGTLQTLDETIIVENGILIAPKPDPDKEDFGNNPITDTFTVSSLDAWNAAIAAIKAGGPGKNYVINVTGSFDVPNPGIATTFNPATNITVSLRGSGTLTTTGSGDLIRVVANQTVILRGLTLQGNSSTIVAVNGGTFTMHSGTITGNTGTAGNGGGVIAQTNGTFTMHGGTISGNTAANGGGVCVGYGTTAAGSGTFVMYGGTISGNTATTNGGGVYVNSNGTFRFVAGTIYGTNATPPNLPNTATGTGAALQNNGTAERGTFSGATWTSTETLTTRNETIQ